MGRAKKTGKTGKTGKPKPRRARGTGTLFFDTRRQRWVGRAIVGRKADGSPLYAHRSDATQQGLIAKLARAAPPGPGTTIAEWAARWLADGEGRPRTRGNHEGSVRLHIAPTLGPVRVAELTPYHVEQAARAWAAGGLSPNTVRLVLSHLHACLGAAVRAGIRADNPVGTARKPKGTRGEIDPFSPAEVARLVAEASGRATTRAHALLAATGCRLGECLALDVADFDAEAGTISITKTVYGAVVGPPKSAAGVRTIRVPAAALDAVRAAHAGRTSGPLFPGPGGGRRSRTATRAAWTRLLKRCGLRYRNLHQLRHSAATNMIAAGVPLADAAKYLGDRVETLIRTYVHPSGFDACAALDRLLDG